MITIFLRTLLIYAILAGAMRLMGKRQVGELEVSELIITLLLSEIATLPIENQDIPVLYAVIPIVTLLMLEVGSSVLMMRCPRLKQKLGTTPSMLIVRGKLNQQELIRNRLSVEELLSELRQQGVADLREVEYAILEKNGKMSIILWEQYRPVSARDLKLDTQEEGLMHLVIGHGVINEYSLQLLRRDRAWVASVLRKHRIAQEQVLYLLCDDAGNVELLRKDERGA